MKSLILISRKRFCLNTISTFRPSDNLDQILKECRLYVLSNKIQAILPELDDEHIVLNDFTNKNLNNFEEFIKKNKTIEAYLRQQYFIPFSLTIEEKYKDYRSRKMDTNISFVDYSRFKIYYPYLSLFIFFIKKQKLNKAQSELDYIGESKEFVSTFIDLSQPHLWFPKARLMKRKIIYHYGSTNSGKTTNAIKALIKSPSGIYVAPLRLLAWEMHEKIEKAGVVCNLETGQEEIKNEQNTHVSCTIEKINLQRHYHTAVIDEIQLINNSDRGFSWTLAFLGLQAEEIHLCGDDRALWLIHEICKKTGDNLEAVYYNRLSTLMVHERPLTLREVPHLLTLQPGDCLIAFKRKEVLKYKEIIRKKYPDYNLSVIYGSLPPQTKKNQAINFNNEDQNLNQYKNILIATDAIGLGLNLNIKRIIFTSVRKFDGNKVRYLTTQEIQQIAGRAGRSNVNGEVSALTFNVLKYVVNAMNNYGNLTITNLNNTNNEPSTQKKIIKIGSQLMEIEPKKSNSKIIENNNLNVNTKQIINDNFDFTDNQKSIKKACLYFDLYSVIQISEELQRIFSYKKIRLYDLIVLYMNLDSDDSSLYFIRNLSKIKEVAKILKSVDNATIEQEYIFSMSPLHRLNSKVRLYIEELLNKLILFNKVPIPVDLKQEIEDLNKIFEVIKDKLNPTEDDKIKLDSKLFDVKSLERYEMLYNFCEIYIFISKYYQNEFYESELAFYLKNITNEIIEFCLINNVDFAENEEDLVDKIDNDGSDERIKI